MRKFILPILLLSLTASFSSGQTYVLKNDVIDDGGTKMSSSSYILRGSFGQPTIGKISSANYVAYIGFWHPFLGAGPGIEEDVFTRTHVPIVFSLSQNYPNPVTHKTTIKYALPTESVVDLSIFNVTGQRIGSLTKEMQEPGYYKITWDLRGVSGELLPNGIYFYRIEAGNFIRTMKMVILR